MIQANGLRLGNYVLDDRGVITKVHSITTEINNDDLSNKYQPILLKPDILQKCGFVANEYNDEFKHDLLLLDCEYTDGDFNVVFNECKLPLAVKELHQLQNLFFCLTGEELEVKL